MSNPNPNTVNMLEYSRLRTEQAVNKFNIAISEMLKDNIPVKLKIQSLNEEISKLRTELQILYGKLSLYQTK